MTPRSVGDSITVKMVSKYSMLVLSLVIGPPDGPCFDLSFRVRSALIASQLCPSLVDLKSTFAAEYKVFGSFGEKTSGKFHWKRYLMSPAPQPIGLFGYGFTSRNWPVR